MNKTCFKCGKSKQLSDYYGHPAMGDGTLGKCKVCVREAVAARIVEKQKDPVWVIGERERCRLKSERYRRLGIAKKYSKAYLNAVQRRSRSRYPEKNRARGILGKAVRSGKIKKPSKCKECGSSARKLQGHHDDYTKPLQVKWLCTKCHGAKTRKPIPMPPTNPSIMPTASNRGVF